MKKGKFFKTLAVFGACLGAPLLLTGCQSGDNDLLKFRVQDGYIQYTKDGTNWENIFATDEINVGKDGNGIKSITIDQANSDATKTTYIITFDDNTTYSYEVKNGVNGSNGKDGEDGQDGKGIKSITIDQANSDATKTTYIITFDDNTTYSYVVKNGANGTNGEDGQDGNGIKSITIDQANSDATKTTYIITFDDNTTYSYVVKNGANGTNGEDGQDGNGIKSITIDQANSDATKTTYIITFDDNTTYSYEVKNGVNGSNGKDGEDGQDGNGIKSVTIDQEHSDATKTTYIITFDDNTTYSFEVLNGTNGTDGKDGNNGLTPFIGENGNWWIDATDTGVVAKKKDVTITLKFDSSLRFNDGIDIEKLDNLTYQSKLTSSHGESLILPIPTNIFGYEFEGWYSTTNGVITANDTKITNMTVFTKDVTIVPKFKGYEANHEITIDGVKYSYSNFTSVNKITFVEQDNGVLEIPYGTTSVNLTETSVFKNENYTVTIPDTLFDDANLLFFDEIVDYETMTTTYLVSKKVETLNIQCADENTELELTTCYPFTNVSNVHVEGIVTQVYVETFKNYSNLTILTDLTSTSSGYVELKKCTYIGNSAFENTNINKVAFAFDSEETGYIGEKAFRNCTNLTIVTLGNKSNSIIRVSSDIFYGCSKLMQIGVKNMSVDVMLPASEFESMQWNKYTSVHPGTLLESDVTAIQKNQEYVIYKNEAVS